MHYPWWYVPHLTSPMLIAAISVLHVLVSHYAVGGGLFLAVETGYAYRTGNRGYLDYLHRHAGFFILLTVVFGAITGVGIWWTIGLASPLATETLIRTFVFGWATEWAFFIVEITSAFLFYYFWGRLAERVHVAIGWIYAIAAWISLVLITGITSFMLNPGDWALNDPALQNFWVKFFNPQFLPQTIARTGGALLLSSLYIYLHASLTLRDDRLRDLIVARSARPALLGIVTVVVGAAGWYYFLPPSAAASILSAAALTVLFALLFALGAVVFVLLYVGPYRNPGWLSPGFALSLCLFGVAAFATGEFLREAVRKPFVVYNVVLSNQVLPDQVSTLRRDGYLNGGRWTKAFVERRYPQTLVDGRIDGQKLLALPPQDRVALGQTLFQYHCNDCHAAGDGYSGVGPLLRGRSRALIRSTVDHLESVYFMPPWCGTPAEAELLTDYLASINPPRPSGMRLGVAEPSRPTPHVSPSDSQPSIPPSTSPASSLVDPSPQAVPAPFWFVQFFKGLGFTLHMVPMNLWYAGLLVALALHVNRNPWARRFAGRLLRQMPVLVALGVNFGIVPLLFIQLAYNRVFYPATILMAWFWLGIIALLIPAYYGVYAYAWGLKNGVDRLTRWRKIAGWLAAIFFLTIGFLFANGLSLMDQTGRWADLWLAHQTAGAAHGLALNLGDPTVWPRWLLMFGLALGTTAVWLLVDAFWISSKNDDPAYRHWAIGFAKKLYTVGMVWAAVAGVWYVFGSWSQPVYDAMFHGWRLPLTLLTAVAPGLPWLLILLVDRVANSRLLVLGAAMAQFGVLAVNAISRQVVQNVTLQPVLDVAAQPTNTQWSPLAMFLITFILGVCVIVWMISQVICNVKASDAR
ncbi:MAG: cytochrome ubiquinol oxidase subunit I [Planctomycetaceae bacterium]|nr:cytochrome ubiquinol oxidase subunit I [Planctomycetaceae bacterium]